MKIETEKLNELRAAWINVPFHLQVPHGTAEWLQPLVNAVSAIVDPDRTLRDEPEVRRIGTLAGFKSQLEYARRQVEVAIEFAKTGITPEQSRLDWEKKCADIVAQCKDELGVDLEAL